ncbi:YdeI/OmpD-associated family protein [Kribbella sp. NPDC026611]|uniref:YdeI/OmpD-associated family protein n=1 Tax=Kribbella sp. NPDC026611 TaxID=3154911 RepID=UPI0033EBA3A9
MSTIAFHVELVKERNTVRLCVPAELASSLGTARLLPALLTINGEPVRATLHKMDGTYMTAVNKDVQRQVGATAGDTVDVTIELEAAEDQNVEVPHDLAIALAQADATRAFDQLTRFRQRETIKNVTSAKKPETRARRIRLTVERLTELPGTACES